MNGDFYAVIMAGGKGERFWPLSTARRPKQLLALAGGKPLITQAMERLAGLVPPENIVIVTNEDLLEPFREVCAPLAPLNLIGEPVGRDTAAAIAAGAAWVKRRNPGGCFCVLTADHVIGAPERFRHILCQCLALASAQDLLITLGIPPRDPSTGYGYIQAGESFSTREAVTFQRVIRFVEKPDRATAEKYLAAGDFFWNSGMFVWSVAAIERAFQKHRPPLAALIRQLGAATNDAQFMENLRALFPALEKISVDYALMEKADNIVMCRADFPWDDVGAWPALEEHLPKDAAGNACLGACEALDSAGNIVVSEDRLTALIGVKDLVVVQAGGVTLVCAKDKAQDVRRMVAQLRSSGKYGKVL